ncbi:hypothetical protein [Aestuariibaculum suncheonense]|uniref:Uncharacterized protein n=1 Tax=Aestuariibaculum suncheonense TaxID=1028745 RepID=A0A8J6QEE9_9FLAO|nr:hypothetical protein [Aestuariibaculum suncheonense]MBD0834306.1 hypothetical protein [Aestuariibaculum suncheonense]
MKTKFLSFLITFLVASSVFAQTNLNAYKYVIVPNKYDFLKEKDQYQLNSLTKFLFEKYGFTALKEGEAYPDDLVKNRCLALKSDALKDSGLFKTRLSVELKDCNDAVVFTTKLGESREKDFYRAYNEALRDAFTDIEALNYKYEPREAVIASTTVAATNTEQEIQQLKQELEALKAKEAEQTAAATVVPVVTTEKVAVVKDEAVVEAEVKEVMNSVLYAQEIENGYQLVDATPKVVYRITKTAQPNLYMVNGENAIIYKKGDTWLIEYNTSEGTKQKELNIKF